MDERYMAEALVAAERAKSRGDHPVGAALGMGTRTHLVEHDTSLSEGSPLNTATMNVLKKGFDLTPRRVSNAVLYCTVEPDALSVLAANECGIKEIVFGCYNLKDGWVSSKRRLVELPEVSYKGGVMAKECFAMLTEEWKDFCSIDVPE
jgi:tRNA(Arg) A34 adenosine deaminase TadA